MEYCQVLTCYHYAPCAEHEPAPPRHRRGSSVDKTPAVAIAEGAVPAAALPPSLLHGHIVGTTLDGVHGYNCNYDNNPEEAHEDYERSSFCQGVYTGMKWQCVEFARRYWIQVYGVVLPPVSWAAHIFKMTEASRLKDHWVVPIKGLPNGGTQPPRNGDLIIYASTPNQRVGHVGVIVEVLENSVRIAEQNNDNDIMWKGGHWADEVPMAVGTLETGEKTYTITHEDPDLVVSGWMRLSDPSGHAPRPAWVRPANQLEVTGSYDEATTKAFQTFLQCFADGQHGRFTNMNLQAFLKEFISPDEHLAMHPKSLLPAFRKFLTKYWPIASAEGSTEGPTTDPKFFDCEMKGCVCAKITSAHFAKMPWEMKEGETQQQEEVVTPVPCPVTKALQTLLNNVSHPHDLNPAVEAVSKK